MAEVDVIDGPTSAAPGEAPTPVEDVEGVEDEAPRPAPTRLSVTQRIQRAGVVLLASVVCAALLAPFALALVMALAAAVADALALADIGRLLAQGALVQTDAPLQVMDVASRVGLVAIGYLGLFCALITLLAGLLGRGRGRLFIIPGALLTASGLALFATSVALCWPLFAPLAQAVPHEAPLAVALYLALDTVTLATLLADTRQTRRRWRRARAALNTPRRPDGAPTALPPTLAGV